MILLFTSGLRISIAFSNAQMNSSSVSLSAVDMRRMPMACWFWTKVPGCSDCTSSSSISAACSVQCFLAIGTMKRRQGWMTKPTLSKAIKNFEITWCSWVSFQPRTMDSLAASKAFSQERPTTSPALWMKATAEASESQCSSQRKSMRMMKRISGKEQLAAAPMNISVGSWMTVCTHHLQRLSEHQPTRKLVVSCTNSALRCESSRPSPSAPPSTWALAILMEKTSAPTRHTSVEISRKNSCTVCSPKSPLSLGMRPVIETRMSCRARRLVMMAKDSSSDSLLSIIQCSSSSPSPDPSW
mmetsp:Transcript_91422/g.295722  ORF Transcript_91422/g.295722 Transcript_91422/m.295722 type:complete len:299 (-) Transcript_91422:134-1030(-)